MISLRKGFNVPKVDDVSLVDRFFDGAFGGDGEEDFVMGEGVVVSSSSLEMLIKSCLGGMMEFKICSLGSTSGIRACCEALNKKNKQYILDLFLCDKMEAGTTSTTLTARLPILNPWEYDLWLIRIEQYFLMTDYSLWEVILKVNKVLKRTVGEVEHEYEPTSAEEKQDRRNEIKARGTLLMALPNKDQLKFHSYKDAKLLMEAIEKRYGGNKESKKLEIQAEVILQEDMNLKLLRSLPSEWKTHALIWRNKEEIETISLDDFTNSNINCNTNEADNIAYEVSAAHTQSNPTSGDNLSDAVIYAFLSSQSNSPQLAQKDLEQIDHDDLEEMDLEWEMAMLTIRAMRS
ncbi:hypothetical protein Tco_0275726 [Tanacetum coccineum]